MSSPFSRIIAASVDGRAHNTRYRQTQFQRFHAALLVNASALKDAIRADTGVTSAEAEVEYLVALFEVRKHYEAVSLEKDLDEEYSVAKGKDALERRVPVGIVFIAPNETHSSFFSVVSPLSAALAAGNCVVVEVSTNTQDTRPGFDVSSFTIRSRNCRQFYEKSCLPHLIRIFSPSQILVPMMPSCQKRYKSYNHT